MPEGQPELDELYDQIAETEIFRYSIQMVEQGLGSNDPVNSSLLESLTDSALKYFKMTRDEYKVEIKSRIWELLHDPDIKRTKYDQAKAYKKRQEAVTKEMTSTALHG